VDASLLLRKRFVVVTGKGGVGKSSVAAALALAAGRTGLRVLLCEVGHQDRLGPLLGVGSAGAGGAEPRDVGGGLHLLRVTPAEALREYALMKLRFEALYRAVFENAFVRAFLRFVPSVSETVLLGKVWYEVDVAEAGRPRWDLVVLDAPAAGHAVSFLRVPQTLLETVPAGPMRSEAERMQATLADPAVTGLLAVTLPEEMPVTETVELVGRARAELAVPLAGLVLNAFVPGRFDPDEVAALEALAGGRSAGGGVLAAPAAAARAGLLQARQAERSARYRRLLAERLPGLPLGTLPRLHAPAWGRAEVERLAEALAGGAGS